MPLPLNHDDFNRKLREAFAVEAEEHLQTITTGVLALEKQPPAPESAELIENVFRAAHSLKGAARAVNRVDIEAVCQALEGVFVVWKRDRPVASAGAFDVLNLAISLVAAHLPLPAPSDAPGGKQEIRETIAKLRALEKAPVSQASTPAACAAPEALTILEPAFSRSAQTATGEKHFSADTLRVPAARMTAILRQAEGLMTVKLAARRSALEIRGLEEMLEEWSGTWRKAESEGIPVEEAFTGATTRMVDFLHRSRTYLQAVSDKVTALAYAAQQDEKTATLLVDDLLKDAKKLVMLPSGTLLDIFPKQVRDLAREEGKEVELLLHGRDVEMDKRLLDELKDPLVHLVRNAVDHGLEGPEIRQAAGKPRTGTLTIGVERQEGNKILLEVKDDGLGIDAKQVKASAIRQKVLSPAAAAEMTGRDAVALIFESGVSTSPIVTELSGRGLGMAIVREKVERLGGKLTVLTEPGQGTVFRLLLPVTLTTFEGVLVAAGGQTFVIQSSAVETLLRVPRANVTSVENRPVLRLPGRVVSLVSLAAVLELAGGPAAGDDGYLVVIILGQGDAQVAFSVDEVLAEQEVLLKPLAFPLLRVRNIASAALLGSGTPALVLNVADLLRSAVEAAAYRSPVPGDGPAPPTPPHVLVVDDSVTSRMLLRNILEAAGYEVATAIDGVEALTALQAGTFDLLVTDGEMPRMNGFELTRKVRADRRLAELPVVIVTALGTRADRERGIDAGANAYMVKSSFDQSDLLDLLRKLIA